MKKKVFSLMMTLLLAFIGVAKADVVELGGGSTSTNSYLPTYEFYNYSLTQQIYTADEIGTAGTINSIAFYTASSASRTLQVYLVHTTKTAFSSSTDWEVPTSADMVYSGSVTYTSGGWNTLTLSTPFEYNGTDNLCLIVDDNTGSYVSSIGKYVYNASGNQALRIYSDGTNYVATAPTSYSGTTMTQKNCIQLDITPAAGGGGFEDKLHVKYMDGEEEVIDSLNLGVRPVGAWMEPFQFTMYSEGPNYTVNVLDFTPSDGMFSVEGEELPFQVTRTQDVDLVMATNATVGGVVERQFVAITEGDRAAHIWPVVVEMYEPAVPDVWELAYDLGTVAPGFSYAGAPAEITPTTLHNDYTLPFPEIPEGEDGVYKFTLENDAIISAYVGDDAENALENGKVALYTEDFYGEGGPMATNNYTGLNTSGNGGGAAGAPFEAQIGEGTSTSGYFPFYSLYNYSIAAELFTAAELEEAGVTTAPFTSLSWNATNSITQDQNNITIWMANVTDTQIPATSPLATGMTKVYTGALDQPTPTGWVEFVFNEGSFAWDGHSNVMILCQRNNGSWTSSIQWQYHNPGFAARGYDYTDNAPYDVTATSYSWYTSSTTRANIIMKGGNRNRNRELVDFEDGNMPAGWDANQGYNDWYVDTEDFWGHAPAYSGTYSLYVDGNGNYEEDYFISPALEFAGAGSLSFAYATPSWSGDQNDLTVAYSTSPTGPWTYTSFVYETSEAWTTATVDLSALNGTYYIAFISYDGYGYCTAIDNINITGTTSGGGGGGETPVTPAMEGVSAGPVITNLGLTPGTYYLVASAAADEELPVPTKVDGGETEDNFFVYINIDEMPCPAIEAEGFAFNPEPADDADDLEPASVTLRWQVPEYATGWRLIFGSTYYPEPNHPQTIMYPEDGSFSNEMANSYTVRNLWNNTNYFWHVEFNNDACPDGVSSPIWGFTTHLNIPQNLRASDETIFEDEILTLTWDAVVDRTYRMYNVYQDGVCIGHTTMNDISNTTYNVGPLAYNMEGYEFYVTAVYDEGESAPSNSVTVKVSGYSNATGINGYAWEQDGTTGIPGVLVTLTGTDEFGDAHTYTATTANNGYYSKQVYAGEYTRAVATKEGYQATETVHEMPFTLAYNQQEDSVNFIIDENFDPVCTVIAEYYPDSLDPESPYVKVYWGCGLPGEEIIEDFETGDFSKFDWQVDGTYPWSITTNNPHEGTYCMKSGGAGVANVVSNMTVTVNIPADGDMSFWGKISCENSWDYGYFYIDGVQKASFTGAGQWVEKTYAVTAGDHTFQWRYTKDSSVNSNDDCFYVDYITFYRRPEPAMPGMTYDFENGTMQGWTSVDADGDGYGWYMGSEIMTGQPGNNGSTDFVLSQSYYMGTILYPDNYLVSPQVQLGGVVRFYACAQDASYAAEHFGLAVSTTGTNPSDFTMIQEWTMTAKEVPSNGKAIADSRSGRAQGNWYEYNVDLSAYSGMGYVAIRHFNCSDMFYLNVDDITIGEPGKGMPETRALDHYRVYRTNCYNDGPYTAENTVLLASVWVPDTIYIDVEWADLPAGVYKWGVGSVYSGNRGEEIEGPIHWAEPVAVNAPEMTPELYAMTCGLAPQTEQSNVNPMPAVPGMTRGNFAYACNAYGGSNPTGWIKYDIDAPTAGTSLNSGVSVFGGDLAADGYVYATYNDNNWYKIDPLTGSIVSSGSLGMFFVDCAYDYTTDVMYGSYNGSLYTWDLATNTTTLVGSMGGVQSMQMIAVDLDGQMYGIEYSTGNFDAIDKTTGAITVIGSTGYSPAYVQGGGFDHNTGKLYWAGYTSTGIFCEIDKTSGAATLLGNNVGEQLSWCVPYTYNPGPTPGPGGNTNNLNQLALPRESETIWSNCLDKDMYLNNEVSVNVLLNSADSPEGVQVTFTNYNEYEQQTYGGYDVTLDESGYYEFETFRKGEYKVNVTFDGYEPIEDSVSIWEPTDLRYVMIELFYGVENLYVSRTGWAMWDDSHVPGGGGGGGGQGGNGDTFSDDFEGGLGNWTIVDADGDGHNWYHSSLSQTYSCYDYTGWGHNESNGFAVSQSYTDCTYDSYDPNNFMITNQKYSISSNSVLNFWADYGNDSYPDHFGVAVATADNPTPADFTIVWEGNAKSGNAGKSQIRHNGDRYFNWRSHSVDLSAYAGQNVYIAFRHFNSYDQYEIYIDDVELTNGAKSGDRHLEYYKVMCTSIDGVPIFNYNTTHPFCQLSTNEPYNAPLVEGEHYLCKVACMYSTGLGEWCEPVEWEYEPCDHWGPVDEVEVNVNGQGNHIEWVFEHGFNPYDPGTGGGGGGGQASFDWYYYDNGVNEDAIGTGGGNFWWAVMFPAGSYEGHQVAKVAAYDYMAMTGTASIYQGGSNAPAGSALGQTNVTLTGSENFVEFEFAAPVTVDPAQNLWVVFYNGSGATYPAAVCANTGDANGRWVSLDGSTWEDLASYGLDYTFMLRAYIGDGAKGAYYGASEPVNNNGQFKKGGELAISGQGPRVRSGENVHFSMINENSLQFNIGEIANYDGRVYFLHKLMNDNRFSVINGEQVGMFIVSSYSVDNLEESFADFAEQTTNSFARMDKYAAADYANEYKGTLPASFINNLMMDMYIQSRENNMCEFADPFCTDNGMYEFPAGVNAGSGEAGPDYDCLYTQPNPAWYYMRMGSAGGMDIHMYSTPQVDIDFCCWGPFDDPTTPCPYGLTEDKVVSCSYSTSWTEHCMIPDNAQVGEYYILVITNYSNQTCNINFSSVGGAGTTDCGILPPVDLIGFLITMDGEYVAFAEPTAREFTHEGEFGDHEYCVRPIYPGEMTLPDHNYGWSMGCPVCAETNGQIVCEPGAPIHAELMPGNDDIKVWWGVPPAAPISEWLYYDDGTYATSVGAGGTIYWGTMFPAAAMAPYAGTSLTKVALHTSYAGSATLNVYVGGAQPGGSPAATQTFTMAGDQEFMEVTLNNPVALDGTQNLWITFYQSGVTYPADACNDTGDANNRWVSIDGSSWMDLSTAGLPGYGWMIRGYVTNQAKGGIVSLPEFKGNVGGELSHTAVVSKPADLSFMNRAELVKYNVYRSTEANGTYELIASVNETGADYYEYIDSPTEAGTYYYQVRAEYDNECESEPAQAADDPTVNYVSETTTAAGIGENDGNVALYPNPTKGNVTIEAEGMSRITVVSVLGQVVFDTELDADTYTLNMAQFNAGMYMVRVYTENGMTVKRVTVMQ